MALATAPDHIALVQGGAERRFLLARRLLSAPAMIVVGVFGVLPLMIMLIYSFLVPATYGGVEWEFTLENYIGFLFQRDIFDDTLHFVPDYLQIYIRTFALAG